MLAQSTSVFTEGARKTKRSKFTTTKATRTSPAIRKTAGGTRCGRKWLIHLPTIAGINRKSATTSVRRRLATARTAEINTRENRSDTIISPPLTSSTNGKAKKSSPRATKSWTVVKRRNLGIRNDFTLSLIDSPFLVRAFSPTDTFGSPPSNHGRLIPSQWQQQKSRRCVSPHRYRAGRYSVRLCLRRQGSDRL